MVDYAEVTHDESTIAHWQDWERVYRFGVLLIFPPDPPRGEVNRLRAHYDPRSQDICDAHISLTIPLPRPISPDHWRELASIAAQFPPFQIHYGPLRNYLPYPGVCLTIEPQDVLNRLVTALESAAVFAGAPLRGHPFSAHMTLAEFITAAETEALMHELAEVAPTGVFTCTALSYTAPDANFHFTERRRLELGASSA